VRAGFQAPALKSARLQPAKPVPPLIHASLPNHQTSDLGMAGCCEHASWSPLLWSLSGFLAL
jgi:hypothetical protein